MTKIKDYLKSKWKDILFIVISMLLVISGVAIYKYFNEKDISNMSNDKNNEILYKNELNNIFGDEWYEASFYIGKWSINTSIDDFNLISLVTDDLSSNPTDIGEYYINLLNPTNTWNSNLNLFNVNDFPYFEIDFNGSREPIYQNLNLLINNCSFYSSLYVDYGLKNPNNNSISVITSQNLVNSYLIMNNESYYNFKVTFLRFRSGISISSVGAENGFSARFGNSYTYSPFISITDGISPESYSYLQTQYNDLQNQFDALNGAYNNLTSRYNILEQNYNNLLEQYNTLLNATDYSFSELFWSISAVPFLCFNKHF